MRVLVLTDSVALPRMKPQQTNYCNSWPALLRTENVEVLQCSIGGATSSIIKQQSKYYHPESIQPDLVIIQCGIVDCAPRYLTNFEKSCILKVPFIGTRIIRFLKTSRIAKNRKAVETNQREFKENLDFLNKFFSCKVFFVEILPAFPKYEELLPGITDNITAYNSIISENFRIINLNGFKEDFVMSDFHHLNGKGHKFVFEKIMQEIQYNKIGKI